MWGDKYNRENYYSIAYDLYSRNILDNNELIIIKDIKIKSTNMDKQKEKDDYEL